jgi:glyoxylase-like metal-dependent hydrolase (beta-lactamase superfamily II)
MLQLEIFEFNPFRENTYVLHDESGEAAIVDPGCHDEQEYQQLKKFLEYKKLRPKYVLNTHGHVDHVLGNKRVKEGLGLPILGHAEDEPLVLDAVTHGMLFGLDIEQPPGFDTFINEGETIKIGGSALELFHVPGHSPGSLAFYNQPSGILIVGDVLFSGSIGRTDLPGGDFDTLIQGIREKILTLPPDTKVYPGHGPSTSIENEKKHNPFLK